MSHCRRVVISESRRPICTDWRFSSLRCQFCQWPESCQSSINVTSKEDVRAVASDKDNNYEHIKSCRSRRSCR